MNGPDVVNCIADAPPPERMRACACDSGAAAELSAYQQAVLRDLSDTGLELVHALRDRVRHDDALPAETVGLAFHRLSRAVRLTLAMQTEVMAQVMAQATGTAHDAKTTAPARSPTAARKAELDETLETVIREESDKPFRERHTREMRERLTDLADREDFLDRPRGEIIAQICKDLGLKIDWQDWFKGEEWALEAAESCGIDPENPPPRPAVVTGRSPGPDRARAILALLAMYAPPGSPFANPPLLPPGDERVPGAGERDANTGPPGGMRPATPDLLEQTGPPPRQEPPSPNRLTPAARRQALSQKLAARLPAASLQRMARSAPRP